jgi:hypothetical protein
VEKRLPQAKHLTLPSRLGSAGLGLEVVSWALAVVVIKAGRFVVMSTKGCLVVASKAGLLFEAISLKIKTIQIYRSVLPDLSICGLLQTYGSVCKFLVIKFEFGVSFRISLAGERHDLDVNSNLEF